jgi:S-DNA-T family DNA segregation ATPase FtsK/SpoIIIE
MTYHHARGRDPLIDSKTQETLQRRGAELMGLVLIAFSVVIGLILFSYSPTDPGLASASDIPVQNWLGTFGANVASPLMLILGLGAWSFAIMLFTWGIRFFLHKGSDRATTRLVFAPIAIALFSIYAASLVPAAAWTHNFGMGGLFGDTVVGSLLSFLPVSPGVGITLVLLTSIGAMVALGLFVLGFDKEELRTIARFLYIGVVMSYAALATAMGRGANKAIVVARDAHDKTAQRRDIKLSRDADVEDDFLEYDFAPKVEVNEPKSSFLSRMPLLKKKFETMPEPELVESVSNVQVDEMPGEERIKSRISEIIRSRHAPSAQDVLEQERPLTKGRGRGPDALVLGAEPRLTRAERIEPSFLSQPSHGHDSVDPADAFEDMAFTSDPIDEDWEQDLYEPQDVPQSQLEQSGYESKKNVVQQPTRKPIQQSVRARAEAQPALNFGDANRVEFELPPLGLLENPATIQRLHLSDEALEENARLLEAVLDDYGVKGEIVSVRPGPVVTMYELEPAPGLKASRVIGLADDIARSMSALSARVSTVPGRSVIGIELPNENREKVVLREILSSRAFGDVNHKLPLALGKDIGGEPIVANLAKMPHLLIAGTTGSGKSVAINTMILSLLYKLTPEECRLIMIDPKMLELSVYDGIPHLLSPVVTDPKKAVVALKWVVGEMEERYRKMSKMGVRNIDGYNGRVQDALSKGEMFSRTIQTGFDDETGDPVFETEEFKPEKMPYIVVIVDEMADLMMVAGKEIEACIQRLAQMARASGIHLIMATQRPSVDVITGTIKANFPTRISFQVTSKIDSRTILGEMGAEQLLGMGDMLYMAGGSKIMRCHGPFVSDEEVEEIVNHLKAFGPPDYKSGVVDGPEDDKVDSIDLVLGLGGNTDGEDALYDQAVAIVLKDRKVSTSYIQRKLAIGYNKAARLVEQMEDEGLISAANHVGKREILVPEQQ